MTVRIGRDVSAAALWRVLTALHGYHPGTRSQSARTRTPVVRMPSGPVWRIERSGIRLDLHRDQACHPGRQHFFPLYPNQAASYAVSAGHFSDHRVSMQRLLHNPQLLLRSPASMRFPPHTTLNLFRKSSRTTVVRPLSSISGNQNLFHVRQSRQSPAAHARCRSGHAYDYRGLLCRAMGSSPDSKPDREHVRDQQTPDCRNQGRAVAGYCPTYGVQADNRRRETWRQLMGRTRLPRSPRVSPFTKGLEITAT